VNLKWGQSLLFAVGLMLSYEPVSKTTGFSLVHELLYWTAFVSNLFLLLIYKLILLLYDFIRLALFLSILVRFGLTEFGFHNTSLRFGILVYWATGYQNHCA